MTTEMNPYRCLRNLERYINSLPPARRLNTLSHAQREVMKTMLQNMELASGQARFSLGDEDAEARVKGLALVLERLKEVHDSILAAGMHDLLDAADVAQLTALTEVSIESVKKST